MNFLKKIIGIVTKVFVAIAGFFALYISLFKGKKAPLESDKKTIDPEVARLKKEDEIEKADSHTLVVNSVNSATHSRTISANQQRFRTAANSAVSDVLRRNSSSDS